MAGRHPAFECHIEFNRIPRCNGHILAARAEYLAGGGFARRQSQRTGRRVDRRGNAASDEVTGVDRSEQIARGRNDRSVDLLAQT